MFAEALTTGHGANTSDARIPVMPQNDSYVSGIDTAAITSRARRTADISRPPAGDPHASLPTHAPKSAGVTGVAQEKSPEPYPA